MRKQIINSKKAPAAIGPYSQSVRAGNLLFISGQIPVNGETGLIPENIKEQTRQCMENIRLVLDEAGLDFRDIIKCGIFLKDMGNFSAINEIYGSYFTSDYPARFAVEVARLPKDVLVEIEAIAMFQD